MIVGGHELLSKHLLYRLAHQNHIAEVSKVNVFPYVTILEFLNRYKRETKEDMYRRERMRRGGHEVNSDQKR